MTSLTLSRLNWLAACLVPVLLWHPLTASQASGPDETPRGKILTETGVRAGLIVHIGCGDGTLTTTLRSGDDFLVHGLDTDADNVRQTRDRIAQLELQGVVTADTFDGQTLPLIDNVANLIVAESLGDVPMAEVQRALVPDGVAYIDGKKTVKPRPENIDDWTHYLHDASNNAVAHDDVVGPPRRLQWQCGPRWSRHHDHMASVSAMVTAGGRVFSILDEGSRLSPQLPPDWKLVARDAFNGVQLWKRPIDRWFDALWPLKSGPASLPRRLVAVGDVVYVTLGIDAPVSALDAVTGETLCTYAGTEGSDEIIYLDGVLVALVNRTPFDPAVDLAGDAEEGKSRDSRTTYSEKMKHIWAGVRSARWANADRAVVAIDVSDNRTLWTTDSRVIPLSLAGDADHVYFHNGKQIVALDRRTGRPAWTSESVPVWEGLQGQGLQSWFAPTLVAQDGKVLFAGGEKMHMSYMGWGSSDIGDDTMTALDAATGAKLWTADHPYSGYNSPEDLFVAAGKVWNGVTAQGNADGRYIGHDLSTGAVDVEFPPTVDTHWFHHRCYRAKATDRFILCSRTGIEFVDLETGEWTINHWVRGGCLYGIMPANGLIYSPPHPCACYPEAKLYGFTALAPERSEVEKSEGLKVEKSKGLRVEKPETRLRRGLAYGDVVVSDDSDTAATNWPAFRCDAARSGATSSSVPSTVEPLWKRELGGQLSQPVSGGGLLYVADAMRHLVHGLDAETGELRWTFQAGGAVDSSPTYSEGRLLFGSADGFVYCLRASDGALAWRFLAAPIDQRMVAFERLESVWPVHGSVLVQNGTATFAAGRSVYLDGGLRVCRLDVETGRLLSENVLGDRDPDTGEDFQVHVKGLNMPVGLPDILSSDGERLFMRSQVMDLEGNRLVLGPSGSGYPHLFAPYGFTDDSWFHRTYWLYGDRYSGGVGGFGNGKTSPAGRILVNNDSTVFGYGRKPEYYRWGSVIDYQLYAAPKPGSGAPDGASTAATLQGIQFGHSESLNPANKPLTIAAWIRPDAPDGTILARGANACGFALILTGGKPRMLLRTGGTTYESVAADRIGDDWTHVAGVLHEDGRMEVYTNGKIAGAAQNVPLPDKNPQMPMKVGFEDTHQLLPKPLPPFNGALDEVRLFHRALSAEQIGRLADLDAEPLAEDGLGEVLHLDFAAGKLRDRSPGQNHGKADTKLKTIEGPLGEALVLKQPALSAAALQRRSGGGRSNRSGIKYLWTRRAVDGARHGVGR